MPLSAWNLSSWIGVTYITCGIICADAVNMVQRPIIDKDLHKTIDKHADTLRREDNTRRDFLHNSEAS
jgi:hypothetical protein